MVKHIGDHAYVNPCRNQFLLLLKFFPTLVSCFRLVGNKYFWSVLNWQFLINNIFSMYQNFRKSATLCLHTLCCFSSKNVCFYHFHFFFYVVSTESGSDDKKLSVKLYVDKMSIRIFAYSTVGIKCRLR